VTATIANGSRSCRGEIPEGTTTKVYTGKMHTETSTETAGVTEKGEVPQAAEAFAFLNTAYPCLNEHQLAIGETTIGGKRELFNSSACS